MDNKPLNDQELIPQGISNWIPLLDDQIEAYIEEANKAVSKGDELSALQLINNIQLISITIDNNNSAKEKLLPFVNSNIAHLLADLAFKKVRYDPDNKKRYASITQDLYVSNEMFIGVFDNEAFKPVLLSSLRVSSYMFNEQIDVLAPYLMVKDVAEGKKEVSITSKENIENSIQEGLLIATYDPKASQGNNISYESNIPSGYVLHVLEDDFILTRQISVARLGTDNLPVGKDGVVYQQTTLFSKDDKDKELLKCYKFPIDKNIKVPGIELQKAIRTVTKGYDDAMIDQALSLARDSNMTRDYFTNEFAPSIERNKISASAWHSLQL